MEEGVCFFKQAKSPFLMADIRQDRKCLEKECNHPTFKIQHKYTNPGFVISEQLTDTYYFAFVHVTSSIYYKGNYPPDGIKYLSLK